MGGLLWDEAKLIHGKSVSVFTDKTATMLKSTGLVSSSVFVVLLNFSMSFWRWIIENELIVFGFWHVGEGCHRLDEEKRGQSERSWRYWFTNTQSVEEDVGSHQMKTSGLKKFNIRVVHEAMTNMLGPLKPAPEAWCEVKTKLREGQPRNCFWLIASYCCKTLES